MGWVTGHSPLQPPKQVNRAEYFTVTDYIDWATQVDSKALWIRRAHREKTDCSPASGRNQIRELPRPSPHWPYDRQVGARLQRRTPEESAHRAGSTPLLRCEILDTTLLNTAQPHRCPPLFTSLALILVLTSSCQCNEERTPETFAPPHPANRGPVLDSLPVSVVMTENSRVSFSLKAKKDTPKGNFALSGSVAVDLLSLASARGTLRVDFETLQLERTEELAPGSEGDDFGRQARRWLGLVSGLSPAEREQRRYAVFELDGLDELSISNAYQGRVIKRGQPKPSGEGNLGDDEPSADDHGATEVIATATASTEEIIEVLAIARGQLQIGSFRTSHRIPIRLRLKFPFESTPGDLPETIEIVAREPLRLALETYDIQPRDEEGRLVADQLKLLGVQVGRTARVEVQLEGIVRTAP